MVKFTVQNIFWGLPLQEKTIAGDYILTLQWVQVEGSITSAKRLVKYDWLIRLKDYSSLDENNDSLA